MAGTILAICGASGSGKTTLAMRLERLGVCRVPSCTTRLRRVDEPKSSAIFVTSIEYQAMLACGDLLATVDFGGARYGIARSLLADSLHEPVVVVVEPTGLAPLKEFADDHGVPFCALYLEASPALCAGRLAAHPERMSRDAAGPVRQNWKLAWPYNRCVSATDPDRAFRECLDLLAFPQPALSMVAADIQPQPV